MTESEGSGTASWFVRTSTPVGPVGQVPAARPAEPHPAGRHVSDGRLPATVPVPLADLRRVMERRVKDALHPPVPASDQQRAWNAALAALERLGLDWQAPESWSVSQVETVWRALRILSTIVGRVS